MKELTVLVTGTGAPGAPGIIRALRNNGERKVRIIGVDINPFAAGSSLTDKFYVCPKFDAASFKSDIIKICAAEKVNVIQPLVTRELAVYSKYLKDFKKAGVTVCVMAPHILEKANNKASLLQEMRLCNIHTPGFKSVKTVEEFKEAVYCLGYPDKPVCFKPAEANGSRGFRIFDGSVDRAKVLFDFKPSSTYADYYDILNTLKSMKAIPELIVMEYLPGAEYSVDMIVNNGKPLCVVPRKRLILNQGISVDCVTEYNKEIIDYCSEIAACVGLHGNSGIQVKYDINNVAQILEINPRLQGSTINCVAAGVNFPYLGVKMHLGEDIPVQYPSYGVRMIRRWEEVFFHEDGHAFTY